ncbi:MAG: hypothetical protein A2020_02895 [Lentisphaerae bacterium GWF2_45_14]|nr:MAG: hypothetical protein A2020_02895 [Lentisphaerae bacterium GWF2_45_14]
MNINSLESLKKFFDSYARTFMTGNGSYDKNIEIKRFHTFEVLTFASELASSLELDDEMSFISCVTALGHDIGRFEQYKKYRTFNDAISVNHGELSVKVMNDTGFLDGVSTVARNIIISAVKHHNIMEIPSGMDKESSLVTKIIRDADKLDIYRVVLGRYNSPDPDTGHSIVLGLDESGGIAEWIIDSVLKRQKIPMKRLRTVNELKMLQIGWVFDLNFPYSLRKLKEKNYIPAIFSSIPDSVRNKTVETDVMNYINSF